MASIAEFLGSDKGRDILTVAVIILTGCASFGLGRLSVVDQSTAPVRIEQRLLPAAGAESPEVLERPKQQPAVSEAFVQSQEGSVVASKNGKAYHFPWCPGAKQISEQNKLVFASIAEAKDAGYRAAANCKGLE